MLEFQHPLSPLDAGQLALTEAELDCSLPESYRSFLLQNNGGLVSGWYFSYDPDLAPEGFLPAEDGIEVAEFFGIGEGQPGNLLTQARACHRELAKMGKHLPENWIWIARTVHDDELFLAVSGRDTGNLYLLFARDEYFAEDFNELFDAKGRLEEPADLLISRDFQRFLHGAVQA
ncbi:MAG: SMI1/KNR4 family protein [Candidatus Sericytochromatia bacterium]